MKNTGDILKAAREKKGISIAEVSLSTKINSRILTAMEQGNLSKLPPKTFLRGFVLSYAQYLGLDTDHVLKTFQEEMGPTRPVVDTPEASLAASAPTAERSAPSSLSRGGSNSSFTKIGAVAGIIVLVIVIIMLKKKMDSYESESIQAPVETVVATPTPKATPATISAESSTVVAAASPSPAPSPSPVAAVMSTPVATATPTATPTPAPKPTATATATPAASPTATPTPKPSPSPTPTPAPTGKVQDVTIEALDDVEITAVIDGETRSIKLAADQVHTIKAKRKVSLQLSDGGAVSIIVNGVDRGVPGDLGKPKKVDLP